MVDDNPLPYPLATLEETLEGRESFGDLAWAATAQNGFAHQSTIGHQAFEALLAGGASPTALPPTNCLPSTT